MWDSWLRDTKVLLHTGYSPTLFRGGDSAISLGGRTFRSDTINPQQRRLQPMKKDKIHFRLVCALIFKLFVGGSILASAAIDFREWQRSLSPF